MRFFFVLCALVGVAVSCGARTSEDLGYDPPHLKIDASTHPIVDASSSPPSDAKKDGSGLVVDHGNTCYVVLDVRLCGPKCTAYDCCSPLYDKYGNRVDIGICWIDRGDNGETPCNANCDSCVYRAPQKPVCVPKYFCDVLASLGAGAACAK
jgi:hypothetical protein